MALLFVDDNKFHNFLSRLETMDQKIFIQYFLEAEIKIVQKLSVTGLVVIVVIRTFIDCLTVASYSQR